MYKIQKYKYEERHKLFFSSDWHIFHNPNWESPIWEMRGYSDHIDASEKQLEEINKCVKKDDILYYLGDCFLNATDDQCVDWLKRVNCDNIKVIFGNHESNMYRIYKKQVKLQYNLENVEVYPTTMGNVEFLGNHIEIQVGKHKIIMNHFPLRIHNHSQNGSWNLSGHSHLTDGMRHPSYPMGKCLDVGWDYKNSVWSYSQIDDVMSTKEIEIIDHH